MTVNKTKKFLPILIGAIVVMIFIAGFGIAYSIKVPIHEKPGGSPSMNIAGNVEIAFLDPNGKRVPIGQKVMDIVYTYNGQQVKYITYNVSLIVSGEKGHNIYWHVKVVFLAELIPSSSIPAQAIVPLKVVPGDTSNPTTSYTEQFGEQSREMTSSTMRLGGAGTVALSKIFSNLNPQPGDKIKLTIYAVANVKDLSNGSEDSATSDSITITLGVGSTDDDIQIKSITISSNPSP